MFHIEEVTYSVFQVTQHDVFLFLPSQLAALVQQKDTWGKNRVLRYMQSEYHLHEQLRLRNFCLTKT